MKKLILLSITSSVLLASCNKTGDSNRTKCPTNIGCTMEFRMFSITIQNMDGSPKTLDSFYTLLKGTNTVLENSSTYTNSKLAQIKSTGIYPAISDEDLEQLVPYQNMEVVFVGFKNGKEVIRHTILVESDCCHINLKSTNNPIVF
ncbi:MAG TPA: hypothetical protein PLQ78_11475 [Flavipsychrobacter sp.]|jgi:hypothetical protein|nr:hypothetical protein [Flavipsychrobacter sp.]